MSFNFIPCLDHEIPNGEYTPFIILAQLLYNKKFIRSKGYCFANEKTHFSIAYLGSLKLAKVHVYLIFNATAFMRLIGFG